MFVIRAIHPACSCWVYLAKDSWNRKCHDGSMYYWSTNMMIGAMKFETPEEGMKKIDRLKIKKGMTGIEASPFIEGVQTVYLDPDKEPV